MSNKALITRRGVPRTDVAIAAEGREAEDFGCKVEYFLPHGTLVSGDKKQFESLEAKGYRIKLLPDTNILEVGFYRIDIEKAPPKIPAELQVPKELEKIWQHHLVQLVAPPNEDWIRAIEEQGVDVVEPISAYGLFVVGRPEQVKNLKNLPFVEWVGLFKPAYRIASNLKGVKGKIQYVNIGVYPETEVDNVRKAIKKAGGIIINEWGREGSYKDVYRILIVEMDAGKLADVAIVPAIRWLEFQGPPTTTDERSDQIVAENLNAAAPPNTAPVIGYQAAVTSPVTGLGLSGGGVTVGICDSGVDNHNNATMNPDLRNRMAFFNDVTGGAAPTDTNGHGTHVAGIAVGNATTGDTDPQGFLLGLGMAPGAQFGSVNAISGAAITGQADWVRRMSANGAQVMNNSWEYTGTAGSNYTAAAREFDQMVRDPDPGTAGLQHLVIVFAAGNNGGNPNTVSSPAIAKNHIVVGNSLNFRPGERFPSDDIRGINGTSGRGLSSDNRILPTIVAPGTDIISTRPTVDTDPATPGVQRPREAYTDTGGTVHNDHYPNTGTSMAAPHVSGLCALLIEWWRNRTGERNPSQALLKALLVNGAEDLVGGENWRAFGSGVWTNLGGGLRSIGALGFTPNMLVDQGNNSVFGVLNQVGTAAQVVNAGDWFYDAPTDALRFRTLTAGAFRLYVRDTAPIPNIPNGHQGWGRVSLENMVLQAPASDRGPKIFSDQRHAFITNGQEHTIRVAPVDATRPLRITLVWTDAAGAANANPAMVNDLDLEVTEISTGNVYRGNVFANGFSTAGGAFDNRNNIECVYIQNPTGTYEVTIIAANIAASARPDIATPWQDFALVIDNAEVPAAAPVSVVPVIDRSGSMVASGYVDITKTSSKQFVDLMSIDDHLGVVSFGSTSAVEYPTGAAPTLQTITGQPVRDAAKTEIDGIAFSGCTYMGAGINEARNLLNAAAGSRAMVLLSDGYDNKGCDAANPAKPSALDAVTGLPANMPVYTCAMGPASDQGLLEQIADATDGRYYYMPTIDDLFEIYNYIRGQVTGDAIVVNESAMASSSRVAAFVDALATEVTFTAAWADTKLRFVAGDPKKANEVSMRLRDPRGRLLHRSDSYVRRIVGQGYVAFKLQEPMPGQWYVEVSTVGETHVRYTVGGFVRSPLRLIVSLRPTRVIAGVPLNIATQMFDGKLQISGFKTSAQVIHLNLSVPGLLEKYKSQLRDIKPGKLPGGDTLPSDIAKLTVLRAKMLQAQKPDLFTHNISRVTLRNTTINDLPRLKFGHLATPGILPVGPENLMTNVGSSVAGGRPINSITPAQPIPAAPISGTLVGQFKDTKQQGSYNVLVTVNGTSPVSNTRFVRKELVSVLVR